MREIKFRAWDKKKEKMFIQDVDFGAVPTPPHVIGRDDGGMIVEYELMQYTGLKDKNGKDIYEGDILTDKWKAQVFFEGGMFIVRFHNNPSVNRPCALFDFIERREKAKTPVEVIGNIHENPELLESA